MAKADDSGKVVPWALFNEMYHAFYNFAQDVEFMATAIGNTCDETRADFILHTMVKAADKDMQEHHDRAYSSICGGGER